MVRSSCDGVSDLGGMFRPTRRFVRHRLPEVQPVDLRYSASSRDLPHFHPPPDQQILSLLPWRSSCWPSSCSAAVRWPSRRRRSAPALRLAALPRRPSRCAAACPGTTPTCHRSQTADHRLWASGLPGGDGWRDGLQPVRSICLPPPPVHIVLEGRGLVPETLHSSWGYLLRAGE